jgi:hypothetical protein
VLSRSTPKKRCPIANGSVVKALGDAATPVRLTHVDCVHRFPIADPASPSFDTFGNGRGQQGQPLGIDDVGVRLSPARDMANRAGLGVARLYCPDDDVARHGSKMILPK